LSPDPCGDCVDRCSLRSHGCEEERKGFSFLSFFLLSFVCDEWIKKHSTRERERERQKQFRNCNRVGQTLLEGSIDLREEIEMIIIIHKKHK
jgi:hypothetical protein